MAHITQQAFATAVVKRLLPRLDRRITASTAPGVDPTMMVPHTLSRRWACTHFGIFLPSLPEPYRYLNTMTLIGTPGALCFDDNYILRDDPRTTATVMSSTAHGASHHYQGYDSIDECDFADDGSTLSWGDDLTITCDHPTYTVDARYEHMSVNLTLSATDAVSWFLKNPVSDHFSMLASYSGTITDERGTTPISGLGTVEYARYMSPQSLLSTPLPEPVKLPLDFFTYQVLNLDDTTQLLLTDVRTAGVTACKLAHMRTVDGVASVFDDVDFEVLEYNPERVLDPHGRPMRVPTRIRWTVRDGNSTLLNIEGRIDAPWRYGHGRGYVGAYTYTGNWQGNEITGSGYIEWIDCE
ncbi:hypothetical protein IEU95_07115 [Hoyosella rhizosphaerae]|uniref:AttH domain-containing protein n=1 Tax=Hoyosella rhizosphaerae TaxID=1755582 RepID=A0A916XAV1_9ACTN|nr:DUF6670 family protein [Hoyosella rhizosphaerae]MBN4926592.1 hypothetical protein [Hoyosella rhizosphaerae]GGC58055.1 hypothetical protein GCM10011410_08160 [Hoyosella rhizosphaerae]